MASSFKLEYPEVMLKSLNEKVIRLIKQQFANGYKTVELKEILKKLWTLQVLGERYVIAVSGLQNSGKTTLIKNIYQIPEGYLPENQGRCEKIPVLITEEEGRTEFATYAVQIMENENQHDVTIEHLELTKDEFYQASLNPPVNCIMLELKVSTRLFGNTQKSLLLLPGLEEVNKSWQTLVEISLIGSANCIFLFTSTEYANAQPREVIDLKIRDGFSTAKPLFVISKSDQASDNNVSFKKQVINDFQLINEKDRVICAGFGTEKIWIKELCDALNCYSQTARSFRNKQIESLKTILEELDDCRRIIDNELYNQNIRAEISAENKAIEKVHEVLNKSVKSLRKEYDKHLKQELDSYVAQPIKDVNSYICQDKGTWNKFKEWLVGKSLENKLEFENTIKSAWSDHHPDKIVYQAAISACNNSFDYDLKKMTAPAAIKALPSPNETAIVAPVTSDKDMFKNDINFMLSLHNQNSCSELKLSDKFEKNIKYMPSLSLAMLVSNAYHRVATDCSVNAREPEKLDAFINNNISGAMETLKKNIIPVAAMILGTDAAIDGENDIVNNLGKAFGAGAITAFGWTAAGLALGYMTVNTIKAINKYELEDAEFAKDVIYRFRDNYYEQAIDNFDGMTDKLLEFFEEKMREFFHLDQQLMKSITQTKALADVKDCSYQLKNMLPVTL